MNRKTELCLSVTLAAGSAGGSGNRGLDALTAALDAAPMASVIIMPDAKAEPATPLIEFFVDLVQKRGAAALIANDWALARLVKADGVHLTWSKEQIEIFRSARSELGHQFIIGADAGRSRHEAMTLGEAGADYVAFGIPPHVEDRETAETRQIDLIGWWSEIFEIPCMAIDVTSPQNAQRLATSGADFVALTLPADVDAASARNWVETVVVTMSAPDFAA